MQLHWTLASLILCVSKVIFTKGFYHGQILLLCKNLSINAILPKSKVTITLHIYIIQKKESQIMKCIGRIKNLLAANVNSYDHIYY